MSKKIWLAIVKVTPLLGNEFLNSGGAYVNVACLAEGRKQFVSMLHSYFELNRFEVQDVDDIETEGTLVVTDKETAEKIKLINEIKEGYEFAWGTFHTFDTD